MFFTRRVPRGAAFIVTAATVAAVGGGVVAATSAAADVAPPVVTDLVGFAPTTVDATSGPTLVGEVLHVADPGGPGVAWAEAIADCVAGCPTPPAGDSAPQVYGFSQFNAGDGPANTLALSFNVGSFDPAGSYQVDRLTVGDQNGNTRTYAETPDTANGEEALTALGSDASRTFTVARTIEGTPPHLVGTPSFSAPSPDVTQANATVTLTFELADADPGVDASSVDVSLASTDKPWLGNWYPDGFQNASIERISGNNLDGVYRATFVADPSKVATWQIDHISANDLQGTPMTLVNDGTQGWPPVAPTMTADTAAPTFQTSSTQYTTLPVVSPASLNAANTDGSVTLTQRILDTAGTGPTTTGFDHGLAVFDDGNGHQLRTNIWSSHLTSGTSADGIYVSSLYVPQSQPAGTYTLSHLELTDRAANTNVWDTTTDAPAQGGSPSTYIGLPPTLAFDVTSTADTAGPALTSLQLSQTSVNISGGSQRGPVAWLHITDDLTGFTSGTVNYSTPTGTESVSFDAAARISGDANDGTYAVRLPTFSDGAGAYTLTGMTLNDQTSNPTVLSQADIDHAADPGNPTPSDVVFSAVVNPGDDARPLIDSVSIDPASVDVSANSQDVKIDVTAHDPAGSAASPSGINGINLLFVSPNGKRVVYANSFNSCFNRLGLGQCDQLVSGSDDAGTYRFTVTMAQWAEHGHWTLAEADIWDGEGNYSQYGYSAAYGNDVSSQTNPVSDIGGTTTIDVSSAGDTATPTVAKLSFSPTTVGASDGTAVTGAGQIEITDDLSGVDPYSFLDFGGLEFISPSGKSHVSASIDLPNGGTFSSTDETLDYTVQFPKYAETGTWTPYLDVQDNAGNELTMQAADFATLHGTNPDVLAGVPVDGKPDSTAPTINAVSLDRHSVDVSSGAQWVVAQIHASDSESGVTNYFHVQLTDPSGQPFNQNYYYYGDQVATRIGGDDSNGYYEVGFRLPTDATNGVWHIGPLGVTDAAGNVNDGADVSGTDITVTGGVFDNNGPSLVSLHLPSPLAVNGSSSTEQAGVQVTDDVSGFASGTIYFTGPDGWQSTSADFSSSDPHSSDGTYTVDVPVPADAAPGTWSLTMVTLRDAAGNSTYYSTGALPAGVDSSFTVENNAVTAPTGSIAGQVTGPGGPLGGASVNVCKSTGWPCAWKTTLSDPGQPDDGTYSATQLPDGAYTVVAYPPAESGLNSGQVSATISGGAATNGVNVALTAPQALTSGDNVSVNGATTGVPTVFWQSPINLAADGCPGGTATYTIKDAAGAVIPGGTGPMTELSPGHFSAQVPAPYPSHGTMNTDISITCSDTSQNKAVDFTLYIDPSGFIRDQNGVAISGATVTLFRSDTASGTFTQVPDGSAIMSPSNRSNPDTSDPTGHYGWDVTAGYYKVTAQKPHCYAPNSYSNVTNTVQPVVTSAVQQIPPAVTNLNLVLDCTNIAPVASFTQSTASTKVGTPVHFNAGGSSDANGSVSSYSWNFGDGTTGTGATVDHTYTTVGSFTPTLTVTDDQTTPSTAKTGSTITVGNVPGQVGGLTATSGVHSVALSWSAPAANNSAITGYTVDVSPGGQHLTPAGTNVTVNGLSANTTYTFSVAAVNGYGAGAPATTSAVAGASANRPTVTITSKPPALTNATTASVGFTTAVDSSTTLASVTCTVDGGAAAGCSSPKSLSGLGNGSHTVVVTATDADGNQGSASAQWVVDTTAPTVAMLKPSSTTSLTKSIGAAWGGSDANGLASFDVRYAKAPWNGRFGSAVTWRSATTAQSGTLGGALGYEYCFQARARDAAGNVSGWSAVKCTAVPADERSLTASPGWKKLSGKAFFNGTALQATAKGKTLTRKGAIAGRAVLVVDEGKGFGSLQVLYNGKVVKSVKLATTRTKTKVLIALPKLTKNNTTIVIKTTSNSKVQVDGLLLARV